MRQCAENDQPLLFTVNGQPLTVQARTLAELLCRLDMKNAAVVAEVNGSIVPRENFASFLLQEKDEVELVRFVGGG